PTTLLLRGPSHVQESLPGQRKAVNPISIEARARQKSQKDKSSRQGLAAVGRYTGHVIQDTIGPLEILSNLVYLARQSEDPKKICEYLDEAELHLHTISSINLDLMRFY